MNQVYTVNARKFDRTIRRSWKCELVSSDSDKIDLVGTFDERVVHQDLGIIEAGTISHERFYFNRWYNYFIFRQPGGSLRNYYINICMPPEVGEDTIDYVDLDIDLTVWPDGRWQILDLEEFEVNRSWYGYTDDVVFRALSTLSELEDLIWRASTATFDTLHDSI